MPIFPSPVNGKVPRISPSAFIAETAVIIGNVTIGAGSNIWYRAVLRGDYCSLIIGKNTSIQDNVTIHSEKDTTLEIKDNVIIGNNAMVHGPGVVESNVMIAIHSTVLANTIVGEGAIIAAGATARKEVPARTMVVGTPATVKKELSDDDVQNTITDAEIYVANAESFLDAGKNHPDLEQYLDETLI